MFLIPSVSIRPLITLAGNNPVENSADNEYHANWITENPGYWMEPVLGAFALRHAVWFKTAADGYKRILAKAVMPKLSFARPHESLSNPDSQFHLLKHVIPDIRTGHRL